MKKYFFIFILLSFLLFLPGAQLVYAEVSVSSGFIPEQIWYSKDTLIPGETVKIHTAIWNGGTSSLNASVGFYDKNVILGVRNVVIPASTLMDVSISWKVTGGDHFISARITSSTITKNGKKENIVLDHKITPEDHVFVPVVIKKQDGSVATSSDLIKSEVDKINSIINDVIPSSLSSPFLSNFNSIDKIRSDTSNKVTTLKQDTQKSLNKMGKAVPNSKTPTASVSGVDKPIAYLKLIFLSIASFILNIKIVFYGLLVIIILFILKFIYRKIRGM